jgi:predicted small integral membrane protein
LPAAVETLRDYFSNLKAYVEIALHSDAVFKDSVVMARNIENDRVTLLTFFM